MQCICMYNCYPAIDHPCCKGVAILSKNIHQAFSAIFMIIIISSYIWLAFPVLLFHNPV